MNLALLYRQNSRSIFWIAFMSALAIHVGAVALAKTKSPTAKPEDFSPASEVDLVDTFQGLPRKLQFPSASLWQLFSA